MLGLVTQHGYACLDLVNYKGRRMALLKNPWAHTSWKGAFSKEDTTNWTREMKMALNFDPTSLKYVDNGVFWISFEDMKRYLFLNTCELRFVSAKIPVCQKERFVIVFLVRK